MGLPLPSLRRLVLVLHSQSMKAKFVLLYCQWEGVLCSWPINAFCVNKKFQCKKKTNVLAWVKFTKMCFHFLPKEGVNWWCKLRSIKTIGSKNIFKCYLKYVFFHSYFFNFCFFINTIANQWICFVELIYFSIKLTAIIKYCLKKPRDEYVVKYISFQ